MKKAMIGFAAFAAFAATGAAAMSLADATAKISEAAKDAKAMAEIVKQLDDEDQVAFLARVNEAIDGFNGSVEEKTALYLDAAKAALGAASPENRLAVLAEVFATVPVEALTAVNEVFASELLNRNANAANPVSDADMKKIATDAMKAIAERTAGDGNEGVRDAFAALMFVRASGGTPADLRDALLESVPANDRDLARDTWLPSALGENGEKTYEPMLAVGDAARAPSLSDVISIADSFPLAGNPSIGTPLFADLSSTVDSEGKTSNTYSEMFLDANKYALPRDMVDEALSRTPRTLNPENPWYGGYRRGSGFKGSNTAGGGTYEPGGYAGQTTR